VSAEVGSVVPSPLHEAEESVVTGQQETTWTPAFDGQRPPFQPGNDLGRKLEPGHELTLKHGAYSPRKMEPLAEEIAGHIIAAAPHLEDPRWRLAVLALARDEARIQLVVEWLMTLAPDGVGDLADPGILAAHGLLHRLESRAALQRGRLGLDPLSAARLGRDKAAAGIDVAMIMAQLHKLEQAGVDVLAGASQDEGGGDGD
jgi:hypothetical protein